MKRNYNKDLSDNIKKNIIEDYSKNGYSIRDIMRKYDVHSKEYLCKNLLKDVLRNYSQSNKVAHEKHPERYKHSEASKEKIRQARLKFLKEHPEKTAWRTRTISYPEKCFKYLIEQNNIDKKFLICREYSVFPYYIDFAFTDIKVAVEIDGSQHLLKERQEKDKKKDKLLTSKGWRVIRFTASDVINKQDFVLETLNEFIKTDITFKKVGILEKPKGYQKKTRNEKGYTEAQEKQFLKNRKAKNRPNKEVLWEEVCNNSFTALGKKYQVDGNTIKKWCKYYNLPYKKKDIKKMVGSTSG